jgi:hypothetical protein
LRIISHRLDAGFDADFCVDHFVCVDNSVNDGFDNTVDNGFDDTVDNSVDNGFDNNSVDDGFDDRAN